MDRDIVCFHIPAFEIALLRLDDATLRQRPVAILSAPSSCATVVETSPEARDEGIATGMLAHDAARVSRSLRFCVHDARTVQQGHQLLEQIVSRFTPRWEDVQAGRGRSEER